MDHEQELAESISKLANLSLVNQSPSRHMTISNLVRQVKDGEYQRQQRALYQLQSRATEFGVDSIFHIVIMLSPGCRNRSLLEALDMVLPILDNLNLLIVPNVHAVIIELLHPLLMSDDSTDRKVTQHIFSSFAFCNSVTMEVLIAANKHDFYAYDDGLQTRAVRVLARVASAYGIPAVLPFLGDICSATESEVVVRAAGMKIVEEIAALMEAKVVPHLGPLVRIVSLGFSGTNAWLMMPAAQAIGTLAQAASPFGAESLSPVATQMRECMKEHLSGFGYRLNVAVACAKTLGSLIGLMEEPAKSSHAKQLMEILSCDKIASLASADVEMREGVLGVYLQCFGAEGVAADDIRTWWMDDECLCKYYFTNITELMNIGLFSDLMTVIRMKIGQVEFRRRIFKWIDQRKVNYNMAELLNNLKMA